MCFEILGFDIMLDSSFKPWLLEVNLAPSFQCDSPMDDHIKTTVLYDTFNMLYKVGPPSRRQWLQARDIDGYKAKSVKMTIKEKKDEIQRLVQLKDVHMKQRKGG